ncbi:hypothetical protein GEMRC1_005155 [Eukaryota sp. GEM-RC1]
MITSQPEPLLKRSRSSPSSVSSVMSNCDELSVLPSSPHPPSKHVHVQQTLLVLIHLHLLRRLLKRTFKDNHYHPYNRHIVALKTKLPEFFEQVGYVSNHFLDSSFQAVKVYFHLYTIHAHRIHLPILNSLASFFGADLQSVFLHIPESLEIEKFLN